MWNIKKSMPRQKKDASTSTEKKSPAKTVGPEAFSRNEYGLLSNVEYSYNEDGSVDWRAMIKEDQLFPNRGWFESRNKEIPSSAEGLKDHQLLIKLGGIKELAKLRGFTKVSYSFQKCENNHVAVICGIDFLGNYETNNNSTYFEDSANATTQNTSNFATKFLETIACNRAFVRCVRNFLNIHIVGDDEIDKSNFNASQQQAVSESSSLTGMTPSAILEKQVHEKYACESLAEFKDVLRDFWAQNKYKNEDIKDWNSFSDIPPKEARVLLKVINS